MGQLKEELLLQTNQFDSNINSVIRKVEELKNKGGKVGDGFNSSMSKMIEKTTGFNGSLKSLTSIIGKFGGVIGGITAGFSLADWLSNAVAEGTKLAEQGEGIRIAFERLNRGDLLEKLREETHNTVTDLELMKQAVKFNDFKLNIDQMGTLLAFAQQKAKDTGESVDYMVDSIVTGLGRKSLPILDNLGLSAAEIKEEMKNGGDMTTAVAEIIKRKMKESGDYVETAADRAKQKEVELQNALETLGQTFSPLQEASSNFWHSIQIGAIKAINSIAPLINQFTELGRITNSYNSLGGNGKVSKMISFLGDGKGNKSKSVYNKQLQEFDKFEEKLKFKIAALDGDKSSIAQGNKKRLEEQLSATRKMRAEYIKQANTLFNSKTTNNTSGVSNEPPKKITVNNIKGGKANIQSIPKLDIQINLPKKDELGGLIKYKDNSELHSESKQLNLQTPSIFEDFDRLTSQLDNILDAQDMGIIGEKKAKELIDSINYQLEALGIEPIKIHVETDAEKELNKVGSAIGNLGDAFSSLGSALEIPTIDVAGTIAGAIASVIEGYGKASSQAASLGPWAWIAFSIAGLAQVAAIVSQIHSLSAYANGGVVGGSNYAGDALLARVNSGEMILNGSQQKNLFDLIDRGGSNGGVGGNVNFVIRGKDLHGVLSNYDDKMKKVR